MNAIFIWTRRLCCSLLLKQWISSKKKQKTGSLVFTNKRLLQIHPNFKEISQSLIYLKTLCSSRSTSTTVQDKQDFDFCQTWLLEFRPGSLCEVVLGHSVIKAWVTGCFLSGSFSHSSYRGPDRGPSHPVTESDGTCSFVKCQPFHNNRLCPCQHSKLVKWFLHRDTI